MAARFPHLARLEMERGGGSSRAGGGGHWSSAGRRWELRGEAVVAGRLGCGGAAPVGPFIADVGRLGGGVAGGE